MKNIAQKSLLVIAISSTVLVAAPKKKDTGRPPLPPKQQLNPVDRQRLSEGDQKAFNAASTALNIALGMYHESAPAIIKKEYRATIFKEHANLEHLIKTYTESAEVQSSKDLLERAKQFIQAHPKDQSQPSRLVPFDTNPEASASAPASASAVSAASAPAPAPAPTPSVAPAPAIAVAYVLVTDTVKADTKGYAGMTSLIREDEELNYWGDREDHMALIRSLQGIASK